MRQSSLLPHDDGPEVGFSLTQLRAFVTLAQTLSYPEAAAFLGYTEPAVHNQVKRLQESLGCALFVKSGRAIELTSEGRRLLPQALVILREAIALPRMAAHQRDREIVVVAAGLVTAAYMLPGLLAKVRRLDPSLKIEFRVHPRDDVVEQVREHEADLGIAHSLDQLADRNDFVVTRWREIEYYLLEPAIEEPEGGTTLFAVGQMTAPLASVINRLSSARAVPRVEFLPSADAVRSMCLAGLGLAFLRRDCVEAEVVSGLLRVTDSVDMPVKSTVWAIRSRRRSPSPAVLRFLELTSTYRDTLPPVSRIAN